MRVPSGADVRPALLEVTREAGRRLWTVRRSGLGATAFVPGEPLAWEGWEDTAVPVDRIGDYLRDFHALLAKYDYQTALYGHFGMGCIHCRVSFDLFTKPGVEIQHDPDYTHTFADRHPQFVLRDVRVPASAILGSRFWPLASAFARPSISTFTFTSLHTSSRRSAPMYLTG